MNPKIKFLLSFVFCFLTGLIFGAGVISIDYHYIKFGILMILFGIVALLLTIAFIVTVFNTTHIESEYTHSINNFY